MADDDTIETKAPEGTEPEEEDRWTTKNKDRRYEAYKRQWFTPPSIDVGWLTRARARGIVPPEEPQPRVVVQDRTEPSMAVMRSKRQRSIAKAAAVVAATVLVAVVVVWLTLRVRSTSNARASSQPPAVVASAPTSLATSLAGTTAAVVTPVAMSSGPDVKSTTTAATASVSTALAVSAAPAKTTKPTKTKPTGAGGDTGFEPNPVF